MRCQPITEDRNSRASSAVRWGPDSRPVLPRSQQRQTNLPFRFDGAYLERRMRVDKS